jgi:hypothetical protein
VSEGGREGVSENLLVVHCMPHCVYRIMYVQICSWKNKQITRKKDIDNSECFGVKFVKIYPEMTSQ